MLLRTYSAVVVFVLLAPSAVSFAQDDEIGLVTPTEIDVQALVDYVSERLNIRVLYDEKISDKKINLRAPDDIPVDSLLSILQSALRMKGLVLVESGTEGWMRIVDASRLVDSSIAVSPDQPLTDVSGDVAVTQVFVLKHLSPQRAANLLAPFLTQQAGNTIPLDDQNLLIVTDFANSVQRIATLLSQIDAGTDSTETRIITLKHVKAEAIAQRLTEILFRHDQASDPPDLVQPNRSTKITADARTNQLIVVAQSDELARIQVLIRELDVPLGLRTAIYTPQNLSVQRLERLARGLVTEVETDHVYRSVVDVEQNILIVSSTELVHEAIDRILASLDTVSSQEKNSRIRVYQLKHITAEDALKTLRELDMSGGTPDREASHAPQVDGRFRLLEDRVVNGPNHAQLAPSPVLPTPPSFRETAPTNEKVASKDDGHSDVAEILRGNSRITADIPSNSVIVVADPIAQQVYAELIQLLDRPRPQVLIEAKVVVLDTSDNFSLGVELSGGDRSGTQKLFAFSSLGLSTVDPVNGALTLIPGLGFNGALVDPKNADAVIRAFVRHRRSKVISAPRILVNDNSQGTLTSVTEVPFTSVNASQTVSTTSFAGFAEAGTTIRVTPHISQDDQLQLEYQITLNEFQGTVSSTGVPPPRQTDELESVVTIPDGYTLIVGGLHRTSHNRDVDGIPFVERIPLLRELASLKNESGRETSLFIFLRPIILRDDKFRGLKYVSDRDLDAADVRRNFPESGPILIE